MHSEPAPTPATRFLHRPGGRIGYDVRGDGPLVVCLPGMGDLRASFRHLAPALAAAGFRVATMDLRGHGDSDRPTAPAAYSTHKMSQDLLAVADACGIQSFALWGMSYGGKVGRYLAVESTCVSSLVLIGTPMGPGVSGERRRQAIDFLAHWSPIIQAQKAGTLDPGMLSEQDRDTLSRLHVPSMLGWVRAMLDWPTVEPAHFRCPTLWLVGSEDRHAMASLREYSAALPGSKLHVHVAPGLDHDGAFDEIDRILPTLLEFTTSAQRSPKQ